MQGRGCRREGLWCWWEEVAKFWREEEAVDLSRNEKG